MYSCVFWYEFTDLVAFFGCYCLTPVNLFSIMKKLSDRGRIKVARTYLCACWLCF